MSNSPVNNSPVNNSPVQLKSVGSVGAVPLPPRPYPPPLPSNCVAVQFNYATVEPRLCQGAGPVNHDIQVWNNRWIGTLQVQFTWRISEQFPRATIANNTTLWLQLYFQHSKMSQSLPPNGVAQVLFNDVFRSFDKTDGVYVSGPSGTQFQPPNYAPTASTLSIQVSSMFTPSPPWWNPTPPGPGPLY